MSLKEILRRERRWVFLCVLGLTLFGLLMIYETSSIYAWKIKGTPFYFFKRQVFFFFFSLILFFLILILDVSLIKRHIGKLFVANIFFLLLVLMIGKRVGGAKRWLYFLGFHIQPSEFLKISFLLWCVNYFSKKKLILRELKDILPPIVVSIPLFVLVLLEPDLGTVIFWAIWLFLMLFMFKAKKRYLYTLVIFGVIVVMLLVKLYPYRFQRIVYFLNPWKDPKGGGFQLVQSQIAFGTGGIWGVGLGESRQKFLFLPAAHTDFIFSIIAEELGFVGSIILLSVYFFLFWRIFYIGRLMNDVFAKALCLGVSLLLGLEVIINVGVTCGVFPTKGLPLPFVSYGGSSLVVHYLLLGLVFRVTREYEDTFSM